MLIDLQWEPRIMRQGGMASERMQHCQSPSNENTVIHHSPNVVFEVRFGPISSLNYCVICT